MSINLRFAAVSLLWLTLTSGHTQCADIIGNLPQNNDFANSSISSAANKAVSFTMGTSAYTLDSVQLRLSAPVLTTAQIQIRNDTGGLDPGTTVLASFTNPTSQGAGIFDYTFTPTGSFTLSASTKYWLYVSATTDNYTWYASSPSITPTGVATFGAYRFTSNSGSSWGSSTTLNSFKITGTVVPEPSTLILSGLSVAALAAKAFARRRKA